MHHERDPAVVSNERRDHPPGDAERRRMERDLHDGTQQRLLAVSYDIRLALANAETEGDAEVCLLLGNALDRAQTALDELRELAHGVYPAILGEAGLAPALASVADTAPLRVVIRGMPEQRYPSSVETAVYLLVVEAVHDAAHRGATYAAATAHHVNEQLVIIVEGDGSERSFDDSDRRSRGRARRKLRSRINGPTGGDSMRVVVADDVLLTRKGIVHLLEDAGINVIGEAEDADGLIRHVRLDRPDVAIVDIRMPPTHSDEGLVAAQSIRAEHPEIGVFVLSQYVEPSHAMRLVEEHPERVGYLLKERVFDMATVVDALRRIVDGETVIDPTIVARLFGRRRQVDPLSQLTEREQEVLGLIAQGCQIGLWPNGCSSPNERSRPM